MIGLQFYPDKVIQALVKELPGVKWSKKYGMAYILNTGKNLNLVFEKFKGVCWINGRSFFTNSPLSTAGESISVEAYRDRPPRGDWRYCPEAFYEKLETRGYAMNTARIYIGMFEKFINHHSLDTDLLELSEPDIQKYLKHLKRSGRSDAYIHQSINSIKFYYEVVMEMPNRFYDIDRPIKKEALPKVLSIEQVRKMVSVTENTKHRCIIALLYSAGLRRSELLELIPADIESDRMMIRVRNSKGGKDRYTLLSETLLKDLRAYYIEYRPKKYLFEGEENKPYSATSVVRVVRRSAGRARIAQRVTPHMLRHSFATHLLESGTDIRYIQMLLGHNSTRTTEIYTHVANTAFKKIVNPLDLAV